MFLEDITLLCKQGSAMMCRHTNSGRPSHQDTCSPHTRSAWYNND
jgi:hypothetical protein